MGKRFPPLASFTSLLPRRHGLIVNSTEGGLGATIAVYRDASCAEQRTEKLRVRDGGSSME